MKSFSNKKIKVRKRLHVFLKANSIMNKIKFIDPFRIKQYWRTKYKLYEVCCICGSNDRVALHHLNSLKKVKTKDKVSKIRSQLNRKQIPVCFKCHMEITHGRYNKKSPALVDRLFIDKYHVLEK